MTANRRTLSLTQFYPTRVRYLEFLQGVHTALLPPTYLEIGIRRGDSLALSRTRSIGIDPAFSLKADAPVDASLFRETSDEYFARERPSEPFGDRPISLAFIDGMHLLEFALRDFMNVELHAHWASVVVFDDIFPRRPVEAARDRSTRAWTGDVYKLLAILARHRPDLICLRVDTRPTGLLLVLALDPTSRVLSKRYEQIVAQAVVPDPQRVPRKVLERRGALAPATVLSGSFWSVLRDARTQDVPPKVGIRQLRRAIRRDFGGIGPSPLRRFLPHST
jgi:hypothetical protein